jgi:ribosome-associated protein
LKGEKTLESKEKALEAASAALDKKAKDVLVLDLQGLTQIADHFIICSGESTTQVKAIAEEIERRFEHWGSSSKREKNNLWDPQDYGTSSSIFLRRRRGHFMNLRNCGLMQREFRRNSIASHE